MCDLPQDLLRSMNRISRRSVSISNYLTEDCSPTRQYIHIWIFLLGTHFDDLAHSVICQDCSGVAYINLGEHSMLTFSYVILIVKRYI